MTAGTNSPVVFVASFYRLSVNQPIRGTGIQFVKSDESYRFQRLKNRISLDLSEEVMNDKL